MKPPRKYRGPHPERQTESASPMEPIVLRPRKSVPVGPPVTPMPGCPAPEIINCFPAPRFELRVVLNLTPQSDPARLVLAATRFASTVFTTGRKLRLVVNAAKSGVKEGEVTLVFTPSRGGVLAREQLEGILPVVSDAAAQLEGATLVRVEVAPQT